MTLDFQLARHKCFLPNVAGKSLLDIGSCCGFSGAYALQEGATRYVGIEGQPEYVEISRQLLSESFEENHEIRCGEMLDLMAEINESEFDIVLLAGVIYSRFDLMKVLAEAVRVASNEIVIETLIPQLIADASLPQSASIIEVNDHATMNDASGNRSFFSKGMMPSLPALNAIMADLGCELIAAQPSPWVKRFIARYAKVGAKAPAFTKADMETSDWSDLAVSPSGWVFDEKVALSFDQIAEMNIPDYFIVHTKTVEVAKAVCETNDVIVDVGCATGRQCTRLREAGFSRIIGVEASVPMAAQARKRGVVVMIDAVYPEIPCRLMIANWTIQFIADKLGYLRNAVKHIEIGGYFVLTEKTEVSDVITGLYKNFKRRSGMSEEAILAKEKALEGRMFVNSVQWYQTELAAMGLQFEGILHASYGFCTMLFRKDDHGV